MPCPDRPPAGHCGLLATVALSLALFVSPLQAADATPGDGFVLEDIGRLSSSVGEVIAGQRSIKGSYAGSDLYRAYLRTDPAVLPFQAGGTYHLRFSYRILVKPDRGFEVLFLSKKAAALGQFLPSITITGEAGSAGTATLTNSLGSFDDYQARWNVIGQGALVVDDIEIVDVASGAVIATANAEDLPPPLRLAQTRLPPGQVDRPYAVTLTALGGQPPYTWKTGTVPLPQGLHLTPQGYLWGRLAAAGTLVLSLEATDAAGRRSPISRPLLVAAAAAAPAAQPLRVAADGLATVWPQPYEQPFRNPLGGLRPYLGNAQVHPYASLGRQYIEWNLIERNEADTVDRIRTVTDHLFAELPGLNIKAVPRVYLDWPPDDHHWPSDLPVGDYGSSAFRARMQRLIARLGQAWDGDPRIAFIETGLIGQWGEQHDPGFASLGSQSSLPQAMESEFGNAYVAAFPNKGLMNRYPVNLTAFPFGIHWDVFGAFDRGFAWNDTTGMTQALESGVHAERWKTAPRGGEIDPTFLGEPDWSENSQRSVVRRYTPRLLELVRRLHWNHLAVLETVDPAEAPLAESLGQIHMALGYRFMIDEVRYSPIVQPGQALTLQLTVRNTGSSPLYANWPVEVALHDATTRQRLWSSLWEGLDLRSWLPGSAAVIRRDFPLPSSLPTGSAVLTLSILDPSGMLPAVRFAVQSYWMGGRTPLGPVAVGGPAPQQALAVFDDLAADDSLHYLSAVDAAALGPSALPPAGGAHDCLLDWAERSYPTILPAPLPRVAGATGMVTYTPWHYRHYRDVDAYVGISSIDDHVYFIGPMSDGQLLDLGPRLTWLTLAGCR